MTPYDFIAKWRASELKERSAAQEHFIDLCRLLDEPTPAEVDPTGEHYCFERGARKDTGGDGWADVWKRHHFAWEYKGKHANLDAAFTQLRQYALALENPPLLIVSDMLRFRIHTNWTNSVSRIYEFGLDDLSRRDGARQAQMGAVGPGAPAARRDAAGAHRTSAATAFASLAQGLRERGHDPQAVAHFVNRLVFCMFAEDVGLLPNGMFARMLENARQKAGVPLPGSLATLFGAMATGGWVGIEEVAWFDGGLFEDDSALSAGQGRDRDGARDGGPGLVGDRPVDPGHAVRARTGPPQARAAWRALHRPRQDHAHHQAGYRAPLAGRVGNGQSGDRGLSGTGRRGQDRRAAQTRQRGAGKRAA